jgi:hypothetical protein
MLTNHPHITIVILNYMTYELTLRLIQNIKSIIKYKNYSIVVVDNASPNQSVEFLRVESERNNEFELLVSHINGGYSSGNNIGLRYARKKKSKYSLVLNNDIYFKDPSSFNYMIDLMENNSNIAAVSPRIVNPNNEIDPPLYFREPNFWDLSFGIKWYNIERFKTPDTSNKRIYAPRGCCMLLNNKHMEEIGYFDENTFLYFEEPILAERLAKLNLECWHSGNTQIIHEHGETIRNSFSKFKMYQRILISYEYYLREYREYTFLKKYCAIICKCASNFFRKIN